MCDCCNTARQYPQYRTFDPACLSCGVRILQVIGTFDRLKAEIAQRRRDTLKVWVDLGHSEQKLRDLMRGPPAYTAWKK